MGNEPWSEDGRMGFEKVSQVRGITSLRVDV